MMLFLAFGLVLAQPPAEPPYVEPPSLFQAIVSRPTGKNGYEDYLKGIDQLRSGDAEGAVKTVASEDWRGSYLEGERLLVTRFARFLGNVRAGNDKPVSNPRTSVEADTAFPEYRWVPVGVRILRAEAYVRFADGNAAGGVASLIDGITFVTNMQRSGPLIGYTAGLEPIKDLMGDLARQLPRSSLVELLAVDRWAKARLAAVPAVIPSLNIERIFIQETMDGLATGSWRWRRGVDLEMLGEMDRMKIADRLTAQAAVNDAVVDSVKNWLGVLAGPEAAWAEPEHRPYGEWGTRAVTRLNDTMKEAIRRLRVERTRMRLMLLTCSVLQYRWQYERLPAKLELAVDAGNLVDPLNGGPYAYEQTSENSFRVYSKGVKGGEPIYLEDPPAPVETKPQSK